MEREKDGKDITPAYEEFIKNGTVRKPRVTTGDTLTDDIHQAGVISSRRMTAQETLETKRKHWRIENRLHHVLDDLFREDRSSAGRSRIIWQSLEKQLITCYGLPSFGKNRIRSN